MKKAFTLIEFMIVVAIVTILVTIIFPSIKSVYARAADVQRQAEMYNLKTSIILHADSSNYSNIFTEEGEVKDSFDALIELTGAEASEYDAIADTDYFLLVVPTKSSDDEYLCMDTSGSIQTVNRRATEGDEECSSLIVEESAMIGEVSEEPEMCSYAAPPEGCDYTPGPDYDEQTQCGKELVCLAPLDPVAPEMCEYAAPPAGCDYTPGPDYDAQTGCGMELVCGPGPAPVGPGPVSPELCSYAAPPAGCDYVPGPDYDAETQCGKELVCEESEVEVAPE